MERAVTIEEGNMDGIGRVRKELDKVADTCCLSVVVAGIVAVIVKVIEHLPPNYVAYRYFIRVGMIAPWDQLPNKHHVDSRFLKMQCKAVHARKLVLAGRCQHDPMSGLVSSLLSWHTLAGPGTGDA